MHGWDERQGILEKDLYTAQKNKKNIPLPPITLHVLYSMYCCKSFICKEYAIATNQ